MANIVRNLKGFFSGYLGSYNNFLLYEFSFPLYELSTLDVFPEKIVFGYQFVGWGYSVPSPASSSELETISDSISGSSEAREKTPLRLPIISPPERSQQSQNQEIHKTNPTSSGAAPETWSSSLGCDAQTSPDDSQQAVNNTPNVLVNNNNQLGDSGKNKRVVGRKVPKTLTEDAQNKAIAWSNAGFTHQAIARWLGVCRETITRVKKRKEEKKVLDYCAAYYSNSNPESDMGNIVENTNVKLKRVKQILEKRKAKAGCLLE